MLVALPDYLPHGTNIMTTGPPIAKGLDPAFDVHGMLGGLAKWLRILGFDAAFPRTAPTAGRIFVTTASLQQYVDAVYVSSATRIRQLREVQEQTGFLVDPARLLTRCLLCNEPVRSLPRGLAVGRVPDRVLQRCASFYHCPLCGRVFWGGSHRERIEKRLGDAGLVFLK